MMGLNVRNVQKKNPESLPQILPEEGLDVLPGMRQYKSVRV